MTTTLTTSKGTFLFVGVTSKVNIFTYDRDRKKLLLLNGRPEIDFDVNVEKCIASLSTLTEDHAREVVEKQWGCPIETDVWDWYYKNYKTGKFDMEFAIESLRSLMQAERLYTEVKKKPNVMDYDSYGDKHNATFRKHLSEWHTAQSRTFPDWLIIKVK